MLTTLLVLSMVVFAFGGGFALARNEEVARRAITTVAILAGHLRLELIRRARAFRARWGGRFRLRVPELPASEPPPGLPPAELARSAHAPPSPALPALPRALPRALPPALPRALPPAPAPAPAPALPPAPAPALALAPAPAPAQPPVASEPLATIDLPSSVRFDPVAQRGTHSVDLDEQSPEWRAEMAAVGEIFETAGVCAIVFVHGTFTGSDPLSAYGVVERALPSSIGPYVARTLRRKTRGYIERVLGDLGNFGAAYVRLFEEAIRPRGSRIPCTDFVWSSENHHVGRLEGALGLVRVLATHAELGGRGPRRILVIGHSHAGQIFALATQLLARSIATEAILDVARARGVDVASLETDVATLAGPAERGFRRRRKVNIDFVTFGAPNRYAWASVPNVRALHVIAVPSTGSRSAMDGDWIRRLAVEGSDFPPLRGEDRRINSLLAGSLGHAGFAPTRVATALRAGVGLPSIGEVAFVDYGDKGLLASGRNHGVYTRIDAMLFHARLIAERLYPAAAAARPPALDPTSATPASAGAPASESAAPSAPEEASVSVLEEEAPPLSRAWSALRALGPATKSRPDP